jgi:methylmalonyl-CoA/ethylmalonyl-CoA epimerase
MIKKLHHIGIVVKDLDDTMNLYNRMLGSGPASLNEIPEAGILIANYQVGESVLEFLEPSPGSPLARVVAEKGEGLHHIAFEVDDIEGELKKLDGLGVKLVDTEPRPGPDGKIAFVGPEGAHGVYIELVQLEGE